MNATLSSLLARLPQVSVLVVGDLILDHYVRGTTERISPEAPVPVVLYQDEQYIAGGAANVARNIAASGARAVCVGIAGKDLEMEILAGALHAIGMGTEFIVSSQMRRTNTKTRIVSHGQQIVRLDREIPGPLAPEDDKAVVAHLERALDAHTWNAIIVSDYGKGVVTPSLWQAVVKHATAAQIPVFVDPKGRDYARYRGAFAITPNAREAQEATGAQTANEEGLIEADSRLRKIVGSPLNVITRGPKGVALFQQGKSPVFLPTVAREVFDVTGAGDTFVAYFALGVASGGAPEDAARLANTAAGVTVGHVGPAAVTAGEVQNALFPGRLGRKLRTAGELAEILATLRTKGKRVVFTNGCFDFLHAGHVALFQEARTLGDVLIVATNTDFAINKLKGKGRPVIPMEQRLGLLAAMESVDYIVVFEEDTPHALIMSLRPDVVVKGSNYSRDQVEGHEIVAEYGGEVRLLENLANISTQELLARKDA
jgi:D-beta-D-heptose 7-phosphate kinase / D-beta-D-heptose 1-phosphate adenosyltransferase